MKKTKRKLATEIIKILHEHGFEAYFVGGCVRDMVLKRKPSDFDIASNAGPRKIQAIFKHTIPVGEQFGIIVVRHGGESFEVSTFRLDRGSRDGRRPESVEYTDAKSDAIRRDFTVNGLFFDPEKRKVLDWVNGVRDAKRGVIRTIGSAERRFREDKLRMIRAVRFVTNLNFRMEAKTLKAIQKMHRQISVVSHERVRDELIKIFTGPAPGKGLDWLNKTKLLKVVLPEVEALKGVQQPKQFHPEGDVYRHVRLIMQMLKFPSVELAFGCLLHDIGKPKTFRRAKDRIRFDGHETVGGRIADKMLSRLRFSNEMKRRILDCVEGSARFKDAKQMRLSTLKKFFQRETFLTELEQHRVDCLASHGDLSIWRFLRKKYRLLSTDEIKPEPFLRGADLIRAGLKPGPAFGKILKALEIKQLDGEIRNRTDAIAWLTKHYK